MHRSESKRAPLPRRPRARHFATPLSAACLVAVAGLAGLDLGCSSSDGGPGTAGSAGMPVGSGGSMSAGQGGSAGSPTSGGTAPSGGAPAGGSSNGGASMGGNTPVGGSGGSAGTAAGGTTGGSAAAGAPAGGAGGRVTEYWLDPAGNDANPGSKAAPFKTLQKAVDEAGGIGNTIWVNAGTYVTAVKVTIQYAGTADRPARLWASPGARPVFDFATQARGDDNRGIQLRTNYWHIRGIEVKNAGDSGIFVQGSYNTIENCVTHNNADTGIQIMAEGANLAGSHNTVLNCDSYQNEDADQEDADGFAAKENIGPGNVFKGCRAWENVDDGWDFYAANQIVRVEDSWAFGQTGAGNGDGNGFKLGGAGGSAVHQVLRSYAFGNQAAGFTRNNNGSVPVLTSCNAWDNAEDYADLTPSGTTDLGVTVAQAKAMARNADGTLPSLD